MKKVTLTAIILLSLPALTAIILIAMLTITVCTTPENKTEVSTTITTTENSTIEESSTEEVYPSSTEESTEESAEETKTDNVTTPNQTVWFAVKQQQSSGFVTKVRCENCNEPITMASGSVYAMTKVETKNGYSTIKVVNFAQRTNNVVEFYLNTNEAGVAQGIAQKFIRYMVELKPDGNLSNGMASNAQYWLEHNGLEQDIDE